MRIHLSVQKVTGLCAALCLPSVPARAVFPDVPTADFVSVGMLGRQEGTTFKMNGCGVAIAPRWVLSVSHVGGDVFVQNGREYRVEKKFFHKAQEGEAADLALFRLATPVPEHSPLSDSPFEGPPNKRLRGKTVYLVGYGKTAGYRPDGLGWEPMERTQGSRRVARNSIDIAQSNRVNFGTLGAPKWRRSECLVYDLDDPRGTSPGVSGAGAIEGEGGVADKDSGGGWFESRGGQMRLVAISSSVGRVKTDRPSAYCYGGVGLGVHIRPYIAWIRQTAGLSLP